VIPSRPRLVEAPVQASSHFAAEAVRLATVGSLPGNGPTPAAWIRRTGGCGYARPKGRVQQGEESSVPDVTLRPIDDSDLDALFDQMRDPESVQMAAFTMKDRMSPWALRRR
jgi:hypothetical protein